VVPPEITYLLTRFAVLREQWRHRARDDRGLTTLEVAIIAGGLAVLATAVVAAIVVAANDHKAKIK
jgi:hypothetical protein